MPDYLQWDLWLGPARWRPYNSRWVEWHTWRDFATGQLGNWASHTMNVVFKGFRIDSLWQSGSQEAQPRLIRIEPEVSGVHAHTFPKWEILRYRIPPRGALPAITMNWYNGSGQAPQCRERIEAMLGYRLDWGDAGEKKWRDYEGGLLVSAFFLKKQRGC